MKHVAVAVAAFACLLPAAIVAEETPAERAAALFAAGDWEGAATAYAGLTEAEPENGQAWLRLGQARQRLGDHGAALAALDQALAHGATPASLAIARSHAARGEKAKALAALERAVADGVKGYSSAMAMPELAALKDDPAFAPVLAQLRPCGGPEYRQFDFWLGHWTVKDVNNPQGTAGAENRIAADHDGCVIREQYTNGTYTGSSVNWYDAAKGTWNQTWLDNQAYTLIMSGSFKGGSMVLASDPAEKPINRITWTPNEDGSVRQLWETSNDEGATWAVAFDGLYVRQP